MAKFTFKNQPKERGLASIAKPYPDTDVKFEKKVCGIISAPNWQSKEKVYVVRISIKDVESSTGWSWVTFKKRSETLQEAKDWLNSHCDEISTKYEFYYLWEEQL